VSYILESTAVLGLGYPS